MVYEKKCYDHTTRGNLLPCPKALRYFTHTNEYTKSFLQEHGHVAFVVCAVEGLGVAGAQRGIRVGVVLEEEHPAVQAYHVQLAVGVNAVGPEGGPQAVIDVPFPDVFFEQVVAGAALDLQEGLLALEPGEYRDEHGVRPPSGCGCPDRGPGFFRE